VAGYSASCFALGAKCASLPPPAGLRTWWRLAQGSGLMARHGRSSLLSGHVRLSRENFAARALGEVLRTPPVLPAKKRRHGDRRHGDRCT